MQRDQATINKLTVPGAQRAVRRERLFRCFDDASAVWVAAPPGSGKTTLAASYAAVSKRPCLWYQLDSGDADIAAFFYFMGLAAGKIAPRQRAALPLLTLEYQADLPGFARRFFRELYARIPSDSLLVLDDCHEPDGVPAFHTILRILLTEAPTGVKAVFLSRAGRPSSLTRLSANRQLRELVWDDLRLTLDETRSLSGTALDADVLERMHNQSGGWAAGVVLLLKHFEKNPDATQNIPMQSRQSVFNYFAEEIFSAAPDETRRFLTATAFFPDFTADMAQQLVDNPDTSAVLESLCRQNCFIEQSGEQETGYRYHGLFRDFLRAQAEDAAACRSAAAQVLAKCGRADDAIPLWLENGEWNAAAGLILSRAQTLAAQGRGQTLGTWIKALPQEVSEAIPWLRYWQGIAGFADNPTLARLTLESAFERFAAADDRAGQMFATSAIIDAYFLEWAVFTALDKWIGVLESQWDPQAGLLAPEAEIRVCTSMLAAMIYRHPQHPLAQGTVRRAMTLLETDMDVNQKAFTATHLIQYFDWMGDFGREPHVAAISRRMIESRKLTPLNEIWLRIMASHGNCLRGDSAAAAAEFEIVLEITRQHGLSLLMSVAYLVRAFAELCESNSATARPLLEKAEAHIHPGRLMDVALLKVLQSWLALLEGDPGLAVRLAGASVGASDASGSPVATIWSRIGLAHALTEAGDLGAAQRCIDEADGCAAGLNDGLFRFNIGLLRAYLPLCQGDRETGHARLREVFAAGARNGYAGSLQWMPGMMARLCAEALEHDIEPGYARGLIRKRGLLPPARDIAIWPWPLEIFTLGGFEVRKDGRPIEFTGKTPKKPIALLKALIALGSRDVSEQRLTAALWPGMAADAASEALTVTVHRLRKLLGESGAIQVRGRRIGLNPAICRVDAWAFETLGDHVAAAVEGARVDEALALSRKVMELYRGNFLAEDADETWAVSMRERLRAKFTQHVAAIAKLHCDKKQCEAVILSYQRGLETDDLTEKFYQEIMHCYHCLGRNAEGLAVYRRMKQTLSVVLGVSPSATSEALYRTLRGS